MYEEKVPKNYWNCGSLTKVKSDVNKRSMTDVHITKAVICVRVNKWTADSGVSHTREVVSE